MILNILKTLLSTQLTQVRGINMINYILSENSITLSYDSKLVTISKTDSRYERIIEAIKQGNLEAIPDLVDVVKSFNQGDYELIGGIIHIKGKAISEELTDKVLTFKEQGLPVDYLLKFAEKIQKNPSFNSRSMLYKFLEHNGHPITKDGNFIAYKKVRTDFTDCHTGKMDNNVGQTVEMSRHLVDDNPNNTCSSGLHVATYEYAKGFSSGHLVEVEVDPVDVVAVPVDYDGTKMRVCKYVVRSVCESKLDDGVYDDDELLEDDHMWYKCYACGYTQESDWECERCGNQDLREDI